MNPLQLLVKREVEKSGVKPPTICLICGNLKGSIYGAYIPRAVEFRAAAFATNRITVWLYSCCKKCRTKPGIGMEIERKIRPSKAVVSLQITLPENPAKPN